MEIKKFGYQPGRAKGEKGIMAVAEMIPMGDVY
jgi:hypothetical protein